MEEIIEIQKQILMKRILEIGEVGNRMLIQEYNQKKGKFLRVKRILFALKHYKYLKRHRDIKFPIINAIFGEIK